MFPTKITIKLAQGDEIKRSFVIRGGYIDYYTSANKRSSFNSSRPLVTYSLHQLAKIIEEAVRAKEDGIETIIDEDGVEVIDDLEEFEKKVVEDETDLRDSLPDEEEEEDELEIDECEEEDSEDEHWKN